MTRDRRENLSGYFEGLVLDEVLDEEDEDEREHWREF